MKTIKTEIKEIKELFDKRKQLGEDNMPMIDRLTSLKKETDELHAKMKENEKEAMELAPKMEQLNADSMELTQELQDVVMENYSDEIGEDEHYNAIEIVEDEIIISIKSHKDYMDDYTGKVEERIKVVKDGMVKKPVEETIDSKES